MLTKMKDGGNSAKELWSEGLVNSVVIELTFSHELRAESTFKDGV